MYLYLVSKLDSNNNLTQLLFQSLTDANSFLKSHNYHFKYRKDEDVHGFELQDDKTRINILKEYVPDSITFADNSHLYIDTPVVYSYNNLQYDDDFKQITSIYPRLKTDKNQVFNLVVKEQENNKDYIEKLKIDTSTQNNQTIIDFTAPQQPELHFHEHIVVNEIPLTQITDPESLTSIDNQYYDEPDYPLGKNVAQQLITHVQNQYNTTYSRLASPVQLAFDYQSSDDRFNEDNYLDPLILSIRSFIKDAYEDNTHPELNIQDFSGNDQHTYSFTINETYLNGQRQYNYDSESFIITWYKNRGRTEKFLASDLTPVSLDDVISISHVLFGNDFFDKNQKWITTLK